MRQETTHEPDKRRGRRISFLQFPSSGIHPFEHFQSLVLLALIHLDHITRLSNMALPNLRRLFVEARTEAEENEYSRNAFYNLVLFISSVAVFSLVAQRMSGNKTIK